MAKKRTKLFLVVLAFLLTFFTVAFLQNDFANADNLDFSVKIAPVLNVVIPTKLIQLDFNPTSAAALFEAKDLTVNVSTNYRSGYSLTMSADSTDLMRNGAVTTAQGTTVPVLPTLTSAATTEAEFAVNHWGIKIATDASTDISANTYVPFSTSNIIAYSDGPVADSNTTISVGAKTDIAQAAGTYELIVNFAVIPHITTPVAIDDMYFMQEFRDLTADDKASMIASMTPNVQYTLTDARDGKEYFVSKLADGNIWMTQNLDHTIVADDSVVYDHSTTDIGYGDGSTRMLWEPVVNIGEIAEAGYVAGNSSNVVTKWTHSQTAPSQIDAADRYVFTTSANTNIGSKKACLDAGLSISECAHYHLGNFYNWTAAVAMNDTSDITADKTVMPDSICPAGWRLPDGIHNVNGTTTQTDFNRMLIAAGITNNQDLSSITNTGYTPNDAAGWLALSSNPLFFVRGGNIADKDYNNTTTLSYYWSSTVRANTHAYAMYANSNGIFPAYRFYRYYGFFVRCMAR